ncbi:MAG: Rv1355c family protein [Acidobacteriota bacterium]|nr:Rv1355c family protein [Acidobacteriota bacterium]
MSRTDAGMIPTRTQTGDPAYTPHILDPRDEADAQTLAALQADPRIQIFDTLALQLADLAATRRPQRTLSAQETSRYVAELLDGAMVDTYGVWVHYPWSFRLVHLLPKAEFIELRTNRNRYKITPEEQERLASWRVGVVGLSAGNAVALALALERGCGELRIADFDTLELSNLNRIRTGVHDLGLSKVHITAREIAEIDPFLRVTCFPEGITEQNIDAFLCDNGRLDLVAEECDSLEIKVLVREQARRRRIPVCMHTSDRGQLDIERFDQEPDRPIFHGALGKVTLESLRGLTTKEKIPFMLKVMPPEEMSPRWRASLLEIGEKIKAFPQLASEVLGGGSTLADISRRLALGLRVPSGRTYIDPEQNLVQSKAGEAVQTAPASRPVPVGADRSREAVERVREAIRIQPHALTLDPKKIETLVAHAALAPSGGNLQPWRWIAHGPLLLLMRDRDHSGQLIDYEYIGSLIGLGAAAENLVLSAHHQNLEVRLHPFPVPNDQEMVAVFEFFRPSDGSGEPHDLDELFPAVTQRATNRHLGARRELSPGQQAAVTHAVQSVPGAELRLLTHPDALAEAGAIIGRGDRLRMLNQRLHADMMQELRWPAEEAGGRADGISPAELELTPVDLAGLRLCRQWDGLEPVKQWQGGAGLEKMSKKAIRAASAVGLVTMPRARPIDCFNGGRAVERAWLAATREGLAVQPMAVLPYLFARLSGSDGAGLDEDLRAGLLSLRPRFERLFGLVPEEPRGEMFLFRIAHAEPPSRRSLRRPLEDVLRFLD